MTAQRVTDLLRRPLVVSPMAGGPSTSELVIAAAAAGAVGFLAAGYKTTAAMLAEIEAVRAGTSEAFGVNVFMPGAPSTDPEGLARYLASLAAAEEAVGGPRGPATWDDDDFDEKIAALLGCSPPMVSFTFGCPSEELVAALEQAGSAVVVTVTRPEEAAGAHAICVQGREAGAHRGAFVDESAPGGDQSLLALMETVRQATDLPQIAAGGIMGPAQLAAVLAAGATAAQCGTAFLRCPESGAHPLHKAALVDPLRTATAFTRAFSGRRARALVNRFVLDHADAPLAYPEINNATRPLRAAASVKGDPEYMSLYAGEGYRSASDRPAGEIIEYLCEQTGP
jgi:nitronate monooxygenase